MTKTVALQQSSGGFKTKRVLLKVLSYLVARQGVRIDDVPSLETPGEKRVIRSLCSTLREYLRVFESEVKENCNAIGSAGDDESVRDLFERALSEEVGEGRVTRAIFVSFLALAGEIAARRLRGSESRRTFYEAWKSLSEIFDRYFKRWIDKNGGVKWFCLADGQNSTDENLVLKQTSMRNYIPYNAIVRIVNLDKQPFIVTEKIHGENIAIGFLNNNLHIQSSETLDRNTRFLNLDQIISPLIDFIEKIKLILNCNFLVYGVIFGNGVKNALLYKDKAFNNEVISFRAFDIYRVDDKKFLKYSDAIKIFEMAGLPYLPILDLTYSTVDDLESQVETYESFYSHRFVKGFVLKKDKEELKDSRTIFKVSRNIDYDVMFPDETAIADTTLLNIDNLKCESPPTEEELRHDTAYSNRIYASLKQSLIKK